MAKSPREKNRVLIAGAGPVGMVAAAILTRREIPVTLVESDPGLTYELRASTFHPPTLDMMDEFGVTDRLIESGLIAPTWQIRDRAGGVVGTFDLSILKDDTAHPYRVQCEQWRLVHFLYDVIKDNPYLEILFSHRAVSAEQDGNRALLTVETPDGERTLTGNFLIAADGAASAIRKSLEIEFDGYTLPEMFLVVSTPFDFAAHFADLTSVTYFSDPVEWFFLLKTREFWRCMLPTPDGASGEGLLDEENVQDRLNRIVPNDEPYQVVHRTLYRIHQRVAATYRVGSIFLAGDSAHINNPLGGMGMNGGIHDAVNLAEKIVAVLRGAPDELLNRYDRQRRNIALEYVQVQSVRNREILNAADPKKRKENLDQIRRTAENPELAYPFLLRSSMITSLREAEKME